jgi:hypothetical protein
MLRSIDPRLTGCGEALGGRCVCESAAAGGLILPPREAAARQGNTQRGEVKNVRSPTTETSLHLYQSSHVKRELTAIVPATTFDEVLAM